MRRIVIVLMSLLGLVGAACGDGEAKISSTGSSDATGDDASSGATTDSAVIDEIVASLTSSDGLGVSEEAATCVAEQAVPSLSEEGIDELSDPFGSLGGMSAGDRDVVVDAMDECIDFADIQDQFIDGMSQQLAITELSDEERSCVGGALDDEYGGVGQLLLALEEEDQTAYSLSLAGLFGGCLSTETVTGFVTASFTEQGFDEAEAACVADSLVGAFGGSRLFEMLASVGLSGDGTLPADLESAMQAGVEGCVQSVQGPSSVGAGIGD